MCSSFVEGRPHELQPLSRGTLHMPHGTSLRMGRLGYQSDAQASLKVSYNSLESYGASLEAALTTPYPGYESIGIRNLGGEYNQLATSLLQIENEFYGTIRPKRTIMQGERPLHALRERGVEYVEVRCMDLDPFQPVGIEARTMRFLDVFLLHCLLSDSPPDTPAEIESLARNQHRTAARGREPGLMLERPGDTVSLADWGREILAACAPIAEALDRAHGGEAYRSALADAGASFAKPEALPSARVLAEMKERFDGGYTRFVQSHSVATREEILALPWPADLAARYAKMAADSVAAQKRIEESDTMPFEVFRQQYVSKERLGLGKS